jgi:putative aminopeptidase FrvX
MIQEQKERLIDVLAIPTYYGDETRMTDYIIDFLLSHKIPFYIDKYGNIYATKGTTYVYPCVVAHTDTVHPITEYLVHEQDGRLFAKTMNNKPCGIGGDDKAGVFMCLELLLHFNNIKAAFFVSEEVGCLGSHLSDPDFFDNIGYVMQFDAPGNDWVTHFSDGIKLFDENSKFFERIEPLLIEHMCYYKRSGLGVHPYTDVRALKTLYNISCINFSAGYYDMHTPYEHVRIVDVEHMLMIATKIIEVLGENFYEFSNGHQLLTEEKKQKFEKELEVYKNRAKFILD